MPESPHVLVTHYTTELGEVIVHVYGPYADRNTARRAQRQEHRRNRTYGEHPTSLTTWVRAIITTDDDSDTTPPADPNLMVQVDPEVAPEIVEVAP